MRDKMDFEGKIRSVEKRGVDGMGVGSRGDRWRSDTRKKMGMESGSGVWERVQNRVGEDGM